MKKLLWLIMGCYTLVGCIGCDPVNDTRWESLPIHVATHTPAQKEALDFYNTLFDETIIFVDDPNGINVEEKDISKNEMEPGAQAQTNYEFESNGMIKTASIYVSSTVWNWHSSKNLFAHELMHLLGYRHHDKEGLMKLNVSRFMPLNKLFSENLKSWIKDTYDLR